MNVFEEELGVAFPIKVESGHVIDPSQIYFGQLSTAGNRNINLSFASRSD
jgi:hypothetical protein